MPNTKKKSPRETALQILLDFKKSELGARDLIDQSLPNLDGQPGMLYELVLGVLRNASLLDEQIRPLLKIPLNWTKPNLRAILRLAFYQYFFLDNVPEYALVNESVELAKGSTKSPSQRKKNASFINAVMRTLLRSKPELNTDFKPAVRFSHPDWIAELLQQQFGNDADAIMQRNNEHPELHLRLHPERGDLEEIKNSLADTNATIRETDISHAVAISGSIGKLEAQSWFSDGHATVQDFASQLVGHYCEPRQGERIIDWCAAPGGKTTQLAELIKDSARILALDIDQKRLDKITHATRRLDLNSIETEMISPALINYLQENASDRILVDAPCTGLGTLRRNPDIRYRRQPDEPAKLQQLQLEILNSAAKCLRPGGILIYSVCTFTEEETTGVLEKFLAKNSDYKLDKSYQPPKFMKPYITKDGHLKTNPAKHNTDAFFAARLKRTE